MTVPDGIDAQLGSDAELITRVRAGDRSAFGELYRRHGAAATGLARQFARTPAEVDDLVSESFARVLDGLTSGGGPDTAFRAYLFTTLRHTAYDRTRKDRRLEFTDDLTPHEKPEVLPDPVIAMAESGMVGKAFASLPERWQAVLWHTQVEGQSPAEVGVLMGMSANAVTSLAFRAREGLREAYLQAHLADTAAEQCRATTERLGAWARGGLSRREQAAVDAHLATCEDCRAVAAELVEVNSSLRGLLAPLLLGAAAVGYLALGPLEIAGTATAAAFATGTGAAAEAAGGAAGSTAGTVGGTAGGSSGSGALARFFAKPWAVGAGVVAGAGAAVVAVVIAVSGSSSPDLADGTGAPTAAATSAGTGGTGSTGGTGGTGETGSTGETGGTGATASTGGTGASGSGSETGSTGSGGTGGSIGRTDSGVAAAGGNGRRRPRAAGRPDPPVAERPVPRRLPGGPDHRPGGAGARHPDRTGHVGGPDADPALPDRRAEHPGTPPTTPAPTDPSSPLPTSPTTPSTPTPPTSPTAPTSPTSPTTPTTPLPADVSISVQAELAALSGGSASTSVVIENSGGVAAAAGSVSIATPPGVSVSGFDTGQPLRIFGALRAAPAGCTEVSATMTTCQLPEIAAGDTVTATLTLTIDEDAVAGTVDLTLPGLAPVSMTLTIDPRIVGLTVPLPLPADVREGTTVNVGLTATMSGRRRRPWDRPHPRSVRDALGDRLSEHLCSVRWDSAVHRQVDRRFAGELRTVPGQRPAGRFRQQRRTGGLRTARRDRCAALRLRDGRE